MWIPKGAVLIKVQHLFEAQRFLEEIWYLKRQVTPIVLELAENVIPFILLKYQQLLESTDLKLKMMWSKTTFCF